MTRTQIREELFKLIFELHFFDPTEYADQVAAFLDAECINVADDDEEDEKPTTLEILDDKFAFDEKLLRNDARAVQEIKERIEGFLSHLEEVDGELKEKAEGWSIDRMGRVELAILRLCIYEIRFEDLPVGVAINEAVEIAKQYGGESSRGFVNGVMARVVGNARS